MADNGVQLTPVNTKRDQRSRSHTPFLLRSSCDKEVCLISHNEHNNEARDHDNDANSDRISSASKNSNKISQTISTQCTDVRRSLRLKKLRKPFLDLTLDEESRDGSVDNTSDISVGTYSNYSVEVKNGGDKPYQQSKENTPVMTTLTDFKSKKSKVDIYREAGEYWNKYPKTGYTYTDENCELMPNMSRRPLTRTPTPNSFSSPYGKMQTSNKYTETVEFEKIISTNYSQIQKSKQQRSLIRSTTNFLIGIVTTMLSTCGYFLKWFYWYFILWAILDTVLLRRRYTLNSRKSVWKNVAGVLFLNLALILGIYYTILYMPNIKRQLNQLPYNLHYDQVINNFYDTSNFYYDKIKRLFDQVISPEESTT